MEIVVSLGNLDIQRDDADDSLRCEGKTKSIRLRTPYIPIYDVDILARFSRYAN